MRYYFMAVLAPVFGHLACITAVILHEFADKGYYKSMELLYKHHNVIAFGFVPVYLCGLLPSFIGLWLFVSITKGIDHFMVRLVIAPCTGFLITFICFFPFSLLFSSWYFNGLFSITLMEGISAAFMSVLIFDNPIVRRRIPN